MRIFGFVFAFVVGTSALSLQAAEMVSFNFKDEELSKVIEAYANLSDQKIVADTNVKGKATILLPGKVTLDEAFNQLSTALSLQGFAISKQGDTYVVMSARNVQRNLIDTSSTLPTLKPERMATWVYTPKSPAGEVLQSLRILSSRDGEIAVFHSKNQMYITDWTSNLHRLNNLFNELDKPLTVATARLLKKTQAQAIKEKPSTEEGL